MFYAVLHSFWGWERDLTLFYSKFACTFAFLRRLAASEKFVRDAQTPGSAEDFQIVKLSLY